MTYHHTSGGPNRPYNERYKRDASVILDHIFNAGPYILGFISFTIALLSFAGLMAIDIVAGKIIGDHMANQADMAWFDWLWTFGTTGILLSLIGFAMYAYREAWDWRLVVVVGAVALLPMGIDVYFDAMAADIIRFGQFIDLASLPEVEQTPHLMFRVMTGAASVVGDPIAAASVILFPVMRDIFKGVFR